MWALAAPYIVGRSLGKIVGSNVGARLGSAGPVLRRYLGLCLFSQGGVAVGLSIMASNRFEGPIGTAIITIIAITTFLVEIIGPPCVKLAAKKAGEIGLNVTEEDLMQSYRVGDVADKKPHTFAENETLSNILQTIAETDAVAYPVTDAGGRLAGVITIGDLKQTFASQGLSDWLVAFDLMKETPETVEVETPLAEAVGKMETQELDYLPVVGGPDDPRLLGMLERRAVSRALSQEILRRRQLART